MLRKLHIEHFKSIKELELDCKRINLFIGKPNVGKSNILEALNMFQEEKKGIRYEFIRNLFYDQDLSKPLSVRLDDLTLCKYYYPKDSSYIEVLFPTAPLEQKTLAELEPKRLPEENKSYKALAIREKKHGFHQLITEEQSQKAVREYNLDGTLRASSKVNNFQLPEIKSYLFNPNTDFATTNHPKKLSLASPHGENLFEVLKNKRSLFSKVSGLFAEYGYNLVIDFVSNEAEIQKVIDNVSYKIPYSLVADTLQRVIFYQAALKSNSGATIVLEEPENHSFPPYIREIALEIINSPNQFFIATHSPYLLNTIISEADSEEVSINIVDYENFQTKVKTLSSDEVADILNYGIDIFFNLNSFVA